MNALNSVVLGAMDVAQSEAMKRRNTELTPDHLFWGLLENPKSVSHDRLKAWRGALDSRLNRLGTSSRSITLDELRPTPALSQWLTLASSRSVQDGRKEIEESDLLRFLPQIFPDLKIDPQLLSDCDTKEEVPEFLTNLNLLAEKGKLDPVIGRSKEIRAVMEILARRTKNNPVLVGSAGVGKTAIVEGLADLIVKGSVPDVLQGRTLYSLDMGALMAGTKFRGEFEERIQALLKFVKNASGQIILFIDEIHQLIGAGRTDGAMDAANLLKPALARGELHCIGATTPNEFQKYILNDSALERRFRPVTVEEPSTSDAIEILMGLREKYEGHHGIKLSDDAIYSAVVLSEQYITNKYLPDKAIDLIDEAAASLKLSAEAMPSKLVEMEADIRSKLIHAQVDKNKNEILKDVEGLKREFENGKREWEKEVLSLKKVSELKHQLDRLKFDLSQAERKLDYAEASRIKYSLIPEIEKSLASCEHAWVLSSKHIAEVISRQTGIPLEKILKSRQDNILELESHIRTRVFGQDEALKAISGVLIASYAGLSDDTRPLGSFLLMGPSGVGKTETAKALAEFLFNTEKAMIRIDLSEFSEKHSVAKLIGAPAGYVGYDEGGILTEAVRRRPYSLVLFDEVEKAHPDFSDILLQILDDGRLTDNKGRTIDFKNTIIVLTTNSKNIERDFKPEVLGRLDRRVAYQALDASIMQALIDKQVRLVNERLNSKRIHVDLDSGLREYLSRAGYDERYGARPLQSVFQQEVIAPLSQGIVMGTLSEGSYRLLRRETGSVEIVRER